MDGSCSCDAFGDACTACVQQQQQQTDDSGAFALLMLDAIPADYQFLDFVTVPASVAEEDAVAACIDECLQANAGGGGCVGATFDDSGSSGWRCILVSSYSGGEEAASPGSRFFVTTRCTACSDGFALLNSTCARASIGLKSLGVGLSYWYSLMFGVKCVCVCVCVCLVGCCCCCAIALPASHPCHPPNSPSPPSSCRGDGATRVPRGPREGADSHQRRCRHCHHDAHRHLRRTRLSGPFTLREGEREAGKWERAVTE